MTKNTLIKKSDAAHHEHQQFQDGKAFRWPQKQETTCWKINATLTSPIVTILLLVSFIISTTAISPSQPLATGINHYNANSYLSQRTTMLYSSRTTQVPSILSSTNSPQVNILQPHILQISPQTIQSQLNLPINSYSKTTHELLLDLRQQMLNKSMKFDENFRNLLSSAKRSLHTMFMDTYGVIYEKNVEVFMSMFDNLEQYYAIGNVDLTQTMGKFFETLYQKIFQVLNQNKVFSASYLDCATEQLTHLKPFKDVPEKLINEIRHALVAARTFHQALNNGMDIIKSIISIGQPLHCTNLINEKLIKNTILNTNTQIASPTRVPCVSFCEQVIKMCIGRGNLDQLNEKWRSYVLALNELGMKLSTSYNIETIITPLDVQISEAIMNFQENGTNITAHVFATCGGRSPTPNTETHNLSRQLSNKLAKRAADTALGRNNRNSLSGLIQPHGGYVLSSSGLRGTPRDSIESHVTRVIPEDLTHIDQKAPQLIDEVKNFMISTKSFWSTLPNAVCTSNQTLGSNLTSAYRRSDKCFQESFGVSDINSDLRYRVEIHNIVSRLDILRLKIEKSLNGEQVDWASASESRPTVVNLRPPSFTTTTTTTTTTPDPSVEDPADITDDPEESVETGSTSDLDNSEDYPSAEDGGEEPELETTTEIESDGSTSSDPTDLDTQQTVPQPEMPIHKDGVEGYPIEPVISSNDVHDKELIIFNQPGAQKSSQTSYKLVISSNSNLLSAMLMLITLLIVTNNRTFSSFTREIIVR